MSRIAIVTDTNSSITHEEAECLGVYLLPMPIIVDGVEYYEGVDIEYSRFFELLDRGAQVSTSQPSPESLTSLWDTALQDHDAVIHIPMSSSLSGSCQTAMALAADYDGRVFVVDNRRISISQRCSVLEALSMVRKGMEAKDIAEFLTRTASDNSIYLAVHTLDLLKKSGRITPSAATIATVLGINPVLQIQGGKLDSYAKVRGMKAAERTMLKAVEEDLAARFAGQEVAIDAVYSGEKGPALQWLEHVRESFPGAEINLYRLPLSICCHVAGGVKAVGISVLHSDSV